MLFVFIDFFIEVCQVFKPRVLVFNPRVLVFNPRVLVFNPRVLVFNPRVLVFNPRVLVEFVLLNLKFFLRVIFCSCFLISVQSLIYGF